MKITESDRTAKELQDAARKATYEIFSSGFGLRLGKRLEEGLDNRQTIGDLLVDVVEEELQDSIYAHIDVLEAHRNRLPLTQKYSNLCRQALDLYLANCVKNVRYADNQKQTRLHMTDTLMEAEGRWM